PASLDHLLDRIATITPRRVHVQIATDVVSRHESWQRPTAGRFDFVVSVSNLRRNVRKSERGVDVCFCRGRAQVSPGGGQAIGCEPPAGLDGVHSKDRQVVACTGQLEQDDAGAIFLWEADTNLNPLEQKVDAPIAAMQTP